MDRKVRGYTITEVLIVIAILMILSGFAFLWFRNLVLNQRLKASADGVMNVLETARLYSMTGRGAKPWGVVFNDRSNTYTLFRDDNSNCRFDAGEAVRNYSTEPGVKIYTDLVVVFDKKGYPRNAMCGVGPASITVSIDEDIKNIPDNKASRVICISSFGRIRYKSDDEGATCREQ
ncbi:N-methylation motif domain protein [Hydrogenobacter thermophilus TK-6]|uniref:Type IV pilus assembly protein n=1 Tax=Hydrogenobacter thermophilus (strain DSM 6534 / IAM 12695 / TK-6) TaxID=608538 RepID=D3DJ92_HYDTT|nr:prepilin-type N-terminal cleavage/methylation domain-containing protein [Hydrogenobacter thermophilus]ADO45817.1 N-methylation motif domain protein [Hydrogenobacter thermophilus TK-6]BAI69894.1 type IV pilus assembly protein [Hydrogenobacter thermophilus TK-6]